MSFKIKCEKCNHKIEYSYLSLLFKSKTRCKKCNKKMNLKEHLSFKSFRKIYLYLFLPFYFINFCILFFVNINFTVNLTWLYLMVIVNIFFVFLENDLYVKVCAKDNKKSYSRKRAWFLVFIGLLYPAFIILKYYKIINNTKSQFHFLKDFKIIVFIIIAQMTFSYSLHHERGLDKVLIAQTFPPATYLYNVSSEVYELMEIKKKYKEKCNDLKCTDKLFLELQGLKFSSPGSILKLVILAEILQYLEEEKNIESKKYFLKVKKDIMKDIKKDRIDVIEMSKGLTYFDPASVTSLLLIKAVDDAIFYKISILIMEKEDGLI